MVWYGMVWYGMVWYVIGWYSTVQWDVVPGARVNGTVIPDLETIHIHQYIILLYMMTCVSISYSNMYMR